MKKSIFPIVSIVAGIVLLAGVILSGAASSTRGLSYDAQIAGSRTVASTGYPPDQH